MRTMRAFVAVAVCVTALAIVPTPAAGAAPDSTFMDHMRAARQRMASDDFEGARASLLRLDAAALGLPAAAWNLALVAARLGRDEEALDHLAEYAAMGLARSPRRDSTFAALWGKPRFEAIAARLDSNVAPIAGATIVARLADPALLAEDLAYDGRTRTLYVSSIHRRKVIAMDSGGVARDFIAPAQDGVWGVYGLALDAARGRLWGSTAAGPNIERYDPADSGRTAIVCWELATGRQLMRVELPRDGGRHVLGDIALAPDGTLYATESLGGGLYRLRPGAAALDTLAATGTFGSPQMPVVMGSRLLIPDYPRGIVWFDLATRAITPLDKPRTLAATGIDGLYPAPGGLLAVQNGTRPIRVLWLALDPAGAAVTDGRVLEQASPDLGEPNHGVVVGDAFWFIGNSGWDRVNAREELETPDGAKPPVVLKVPLPRRD